MDNILIYFGLEYPDNWSVGTLNKLNFVLEHSVEKRNVPIVNSYDVFH